MSGKLTDKIVRAASPGPKPIFLADGGGLRLVVQTSGTKSWVLKWKLGGKSGSTGLGQYPAVGLAAARVLAQQARLALVAGDRPVGPRAAQPVASTGTLADMIWSWFESEQHRWSASFRETVRARLQTEVIDKIGDEPAGRVTSGMLLSKVLEPLALRSHDLANRVRQYVDAAFAYGLPRGLVTQNPAAACKGQLGVAPKAGKRPAILDLGRARAMLAAVEAIPARPALRLVHRFQVLTAMRPGEARHARWAQFEGLEGSEPIWRVPAEIMKIEAHGEHVVPLSPQAVDVLRAARALYANFPYVFPFGAGPVSENGINDLIARAGFRGQHCAHGWRSTFSTTMNDRNPLYGMVVEAALAHHKKDQTAAAYNRGTYLAARRELMNEWAKVIMEGRPSAAALIEGPRRVGPGLALAA